MYPDVPEEVRKRVRRNREGKWIFCLAEQDRKKNPGIFWIVEATPYTNEASARFYFKKQLEFGNCFLIKVPEFVTLETRKGKNG